jgi:two-component system sensor histidine kinase UhpB
MAGIALDDANTTQVRDATRPDHVDQAMRRSSSGERSERLWRRISLRGQILTAFVLVNLIAGIVAAIVVIYDARRAAQVEIAASMGLAERLVREAVERSGAGTQGGTLLQSVALQIGNLRHVRILLTDPEGSLASLLPTEASDNSSDDNAGVPRWFTALVRVNDIRREMRIGLNGHQIGSVVLVGHAADEIAEVWRDSKHLAIVAIVLNLAIVGILYYALGRVLHPLTSLAAGLRELEEGQFRHRLSRPKVRELADISNRFNALADRLGAAKADNSQLTRTLVTVQDDERRQIATELHDEIGPCLFGIKANIVSLEQLASELPLATADRMRERVAAVSEITDKIQVLNRRLLGKLRPMALGHVPLTDIVSGLVADFERLNPKSSITVTFGPLADSYGDSIDLTIYRCLQEGITNAARHAEAKTISVDLDERPAERERSDSSEMSSVLQLWVRDDGRGIAPGTRWGLGLTGMDERVRALGGTLTIAGRQGDGTHLAITIPLVDVQRSDTDVQRRTRRSQP